MDNNAILTLSDELLERYRNRIRRAFFAALASEGGGSS